MKLGWNTQISFSLLSCLEFELGSENVATL